VKYKPIGLFLIILIATPVFGQDVSPLIVETLKPTPTSVKTGETFVQLYRIRFIDRSNEGIEITINEQNLNSKVLGDFEVLNFCIDKGEDNNDCAGLGGGTIQRNFLEHIWYLKYTLRIVNHKKGPNKIPPLTINWTEKFIGRNDDQAEVKSFDTQEEVYVNYVTTLTEDPRLDIRDGFDFGSFSGQAFRYEVAYRVLIIGMPILWLLWLVLYLRSPAPEVKSSPAMSLATNQLIAGSACYETVSKKQALRALKRNIKQLSAMADEDKFDGSVIWPVLTDSLMDFLRVSVPGSTVGMTPSDILSHIKNNKEHKSDASALLILAGKAVEYNWLLEKKVQSDRRVNPAEDAVLLTNSLNQLSWYGRALNIFRKALRR
jgi:hypothetical protein